MKRIYEVTIGSDAESATANFKVYRENVIEAAKAALRAYKEYPRLLGRARVTEVTEWGEIDG
jgi:hypothetical protein